MNGNPSSALCINHLTVNYDTRSVLWDLSFEVPSGRFVGIIGPNGAGKSSLIKAVLNLVEPLSGSIEFFGKPFKEVSHRIAYVPQRSSVDWDFPITAFDLVLMGRYGKLGVLKWPRAADRAAARRALEMVGMDHLAHRQISQLSGGEQQRLFIARALLQEADIYFMDEPFIGVDMATEKAIVGLLDLLRKEGKTLFVVHHDLNTVEQYFDFLILLNTSLIATGATSEVFTPELIRRAYGKNFLIDEAARLSKNKTSGMR